MTDEDLPKGTPRSKKTHRQQEGGNGSFCGGITNTWEER